MWPAIRTDVSKSHYILLLKPSNETQEPRLLNAPEGQYQNFDTRGSNGRERVNAHIGIYAKVGFSAMLSKSTELRSAV